MSSDSRRVTESSGLILTPDDGLLVGNGDLSVCVYQTSDAVVFRFGKGDVWDRRTDNSETFAPTHIDELRRGLREEDWRRDASGKLIAAKGPPRDEKRMREICGTAASVYAERPYPCPKPVGELAMHLPGDLTNLRITQRVALDTGVLTVRCEWDRGLWLEVEAFVARDANALVLRWDRGGWNNDTMVSPGRPMVWFSLYRWADPTIQTFSEQRAAATGDYGFGKYNSPRITPLDPPSCGVEGERHFVEQRFHAEPTFPSGFACRMTPIAPNFRASPMKSVPGGTREARLHVKPVVWEKERDWLAVAVTTTSDTLGVAGEAKRVSDALLAGGDAIVETWRRVSVEHVEAFWSRSSVRCGDEVIERTWRETLHARRCAYRPMSPASPGSVPPALLMPSSLRDYSPWHGDYHTNYNIQSPFWGDYTANHVDDLADAFFDVADFFIDLGKKIARESFGCRGAYVTLGLCPVRNGIDPSPGAPMGRMAYMGGWIANHYWWRYQYTLDRAWLRERGYPAIRELALFYLDYLQLGEDGRYHAFPSTQGEDRFPEDASGWTDRPQVMRHMRYCLRAAIASAEVLGVDSDLVSQWRERVERAAPDNPPTNWNVGAMNESLGVICPPEFVSPDGLPLPLADPLKQEMRFTGSASEPSPWAFRARTKETNWSWQLWQWYFGKVPWYLMISLRNGIFFPDRDWPLVRELILRWRRPNGLHTAMGAGSFGHGGAWTEQLGITAPLQEMMLQSWKGYIDLFPAWPSGIDGEFTTLRAEGAFLVSASYAGGVRGARVRSERGGVCRVRRPWGAATSVVCGSAPVNARVEGDVMVFETVARAEYVLLRGA